MITKYGYTTIFVAFILFLILLALSFLSENTFIKSVLIISGILILVFNLNFFRDPQRTAPVKPNVIVSPADGTVLFVKEVEENKFLHSRALQISVFMNVFNVHVNRIPVSGQVDYLKHIHGDYLIASLDKASEKNERSEIGITSEYGKILFTQVAGLIARRIITELKPGDKVKIGERFGMIKFGSRVDVVVPLNFKAAVKKGDKVTAGETILFESVNQ